MPRIYNEARDPLDFCKRCFPRAEERYELNPHADIDADHPPYEDTDYECEVCHRKLTERDN